MWRRLVRDRWIKEGIEAAIAAEVEVPVEVMCIIVVAIEVREVDTRIEVAVGTEVGEGEVRRPRVLSRSDEEVDIGLSACLNNYLLALFEQAAGSLKRMYKRGLMMEAAWVPFNPLKLSLEVSARHVQETTSELTQLPKDLLE